MQALHSDKMRDMPIGKLILTMSLPAMLSMIVKALYNIVDSIYVSRYSTAGLDALSIAFPLQTIVIALAVAIGVGTNVMVARRLGEKRKDDASQIARTGLFIALCGAIVVCIIGLLFPSLFMSWFTEDATTIQMGVTYLRVILCFGFGVFIEVCLCRVLQATGNMKIPMISQIIGAVTNIILDPVFIFGFWFVPSMGVLGAAIATIIGQVLSMIFVIIIYIVKKLDIDMNLKDFKLTSDNVLSIARVGIPTFVMNAIAAFTTTLMNLIIKVYPYAITIQGIYFKLRSFIFMPVFGLTQGLMPILSYNYGANNKGRFNQARKISLISCVIIMCVGTVLFFTLPKLILQLFNLPAEAYTAGIYALRILSISFVFSALGIITATTFQSIGKGTSSLLLSLCRQIIILLPSALLLSKLFGFEGVFFCYTIAELVGVAIFFPRGIKAVNVAFAKKSKEKAPIEEAS